MEEQCCHLLDPRVCTQWQTQKNIQRSGDDSWRPITCQLRPLAPAKSVWLSRSSQVWNTCGSSLKRSTGTIAFLPLEGNRNGKQRCCLPLVSDMKCSPAQCNSGMIQAWFRYKSSTSTSMAALLIKIFGLTTRTYIYSSAPAILYISKWERVLFCSRVPTNVRDNILPEILAECYPWNLGSVAALDVLITFFFSP